MISNRCGCYLEDLQRQVLRGLVVRIFSVFKVVPNLACLRRIQVRMQVHFERCTLGDALFLEYKKTIEKEQEIVQVTCNVKGCPPLDEADVLGILLT